MPDITMCQNATCPQRKVCYRAQATPSQPWQSYALFEWDAEKGCPDFWGVQSRPTMVRCPLCGTEHAFGAMCQKCFGAKG